MTTPPEPRGRPRDHGLVIGSLPTGPLNGITDVAGVRVGHRTCWSPDGAQPVARTGVTAIWPHSGNPFRDRVYAAVSPFNGYGIVTADLVLQEWGLLGSPIILCDTVNVGVCYDATVRYMSALDESVGDDDVLMPVVAECDDGYLNDNRRPVLEREDVTAALDQATGGPVPEGVVGAGTGMQQFDFKGGIGTASRLVRLGDHTYTVGVLVNTNYGSRAQLCIKGVPLGQQLTEHLPERHKEGSCIAVVATDLPLHPGQLRRLARRVDVGLARTGSVGNDGSGEIFLAFSTAQTVPRTSQDGTMELRVMIEGQFWTQGSPFDTIFEAVAEASEEAALNALFQADTVAGRDGHQLWGFPVEEALAALS